MENSVGAQYALQIAFQTLKERCQQFQQRVAVLEEENLSLRTKQINIESSVDSLSELDTLKERITELTEQKAQLRNHVKIVTDENKQLWNRLSKITEVNKSLGTQLTKINDTLSQHNSKQPHSPVIRSKTFTIDDPQIRKHPQKNLVEENDKLSSELEDISLKLINSFVKEKLELELQCSQMAELQSNNRIISGSFGIEYPDEDAEEVSNSEVEDMLKSLSDVKEVLLEEKKKLEKAVLNLSQININQKCKHCVERERAIMLHTTDTNKQISKSVQAYSADEEEFERRQLDSLSKWGTPDNSNHFSDVNKIPAVLPKSKIYAETAPDIDRICPICSVVFYSDTDFATFQIHVESHFISSDHPDYDVL